MYYLRRLHQSQDYANYRLHVFTGGRAQAASVPPSVPSIAYPEHNRIDLSDIANTTKARWLSLSLIFRPV
ncbi:MAG TPA: hypothetical protein PLV32_12230 [Chitinophagaceae bacterium]|nr:hypothetical protein [Chitinophagaceae bacterium]